MRQTSFPAMNSGSGLLAAICLCVLLVSGCRRQVVTVPYQEDEITNDTVSFEAGVAAGTLKNREINEASGMDMSIRYPGMLWTHNDSGDKPQLYLIDTAANHLRTFTVEDSQNRDWEDIAVGRDKATGISRIFIADIGDNLSVYDHGRIYVIDEPATSTPDSTLKPGGRILFRYPDGKRDAETIMVDPASSDIYLVSKRETNVHLYRIAHPYNFRDTVTAEKLMELPFTYIVAGDISDDGSGILMKNYDKIWYWKHSKNRTIAESLLATPQELPYKREPQGESICWDTSGKAFYTLSEESLLKIPPVLYRYVRK